VFEDNKKMSVTDTINDPFHYFRLSF